MCGDAIGNFVSKVTSPLAKIDPVAKFVSQGFKPSGTLKLAELLPQEQGKPEDLKTTIETTAAQEGQRQTLELRRRMRRNSLLSLAGGVGDTSPPTLASAGAIGKTDLGG